MTPLTSLVSMAGGALEAALASGPTAALAAPSPATLATLVALATPGGAGGLCTDVPRPVSSYAPPAPVSSALGRKIPATDDDELRALYMEGRPYTAFLEAATRRAELWHGNTQRADDLDPTLVARAQAVGGTWYVLAVSVDACSDSVSTIPYLASLVERVDGLDMRIVDPTVGRAVMESHPTPDGRPATPTVLLLDEGFDEAGCFIERPPALQTWILQNPDWSSREAYERKMSWYDEDSGTSTVEAFVEMLEAAAQGDTVCR